MLRRLLAPLALALALAACTSGVAPIDLTVTALVPADEATDVSVDVVLSATFNRAIDIDSLDGAFTLATEGGADVAGLVTLDGAGTTASFTPAAPLAYATTYVATVSGDVETVTGVLLGAEASWTFTTEDDPVAELVATGDYATYAAPSNVNTPIDLAAPFTGGQGDLTFTLIAGTLPADFTSLDTSVPEYTGATYALNLDPATGAITGSTGYVGLFVGTVQAEDELGQTATADFSLDLGFDLAYTGPTSLPVPQAPAVVKNGDSVLISGVPTLALPADFPLMYFSLTLDPTASTAGTVATDFDVNDADGTISKIVTGGAQAGVTTWSYAARVQFGFMDGLFLAPLPDSELSAPVDFTFEHTEP